MSRSPLASLLARPQRFSFDAAVRVLSFARRTHDPAEAGRFQSAPGLGFPSAEVSDVTQGDANLPPQVTVTLIGLTGPSGVLPRQYSEAVVATLRGRSRALHAFLALISHRLIAAFAAAGAKYRLHRAADGGVLGRHQERSEQGAVDRAVLALTGYGTPHLAERLAPGAEAIRHYAGLFASYPRSADRLEALASDWLGRRVTVEQFVGCWLALPPDQRTRLPAGADPGRFAILGGQAVIGVRAWDQQARIVLRIGPLDRASFEALLPDRPLLRSLVGLVRAFIGYETGFAINPVLARQAMQPLQLRADAASPPRLGWNSWIPSPDEPVATDAADAMFEAELVEELAA